MHAKRLVAMGAILAVVAVLYMVLESKGNWSFVLPFRGTKLAALILVAVAVSTATVLFQTITQNRILTPSIMGFDALYVLILTAAVFVLGGQGLIRIPPLAVFGVNIVLLVLASLLLFGTLLAGARQDLMRMVLTGIIFGVLFRSLTAFLQRMIDPNEYAVVQVSSYARFTQINTDLLLISTILTSLTLGLVWRLRHPLDVLALGPDLATGLGERPRRRQMEVLILISVLVSVSTALVGPIAFLGLLVVSLARLITPTVQHAVLLTSAALTSCIVLVGGQMVLERILSLEAPLSVVIDFVGGFVFLALLLKGTRR